MERKGLLLRVLVTVSLAANIILAASWYHARSQQNLKAVEAAATLLEGQQGEWEYILNEVKSHDPERLAKLEKWLERAIRNIGVVHEAVLAADDQKNPR